MRMSQSDVNGSIDPQTNSRLLQAPYDIQCQIFNYLLPRDVHVFMHEDILRISECVGCPEADGYYPGLEREKGVGYDVWARRLKSTWGPHWKCEETMREGKANIDMYCATMYRVLFDVTGPFSYGCINHKWQYPVLRGFADSVVTDEDVGLEIEAVELKMWQGGEDPIIILESLRPYRLGLLD
ncbi:hypothetical protein HBH64_165040 [Parastagonospora nodorum]|nr:hypothetical protein HBH47_095590 [Parastagonospora nodorum]KAH4297211.1 hypothetical protein HBI02_165660 [Parastagonospora nodorum]KAH4410232.1 hypothetical protein HBH92_129350 [Parastagonospora nodorum]KAH4441324.1 hypothetical protein HBH91_171420 [Parastagonospora nodorum]KAH4455125.1 hypothetical protein HBH93_017340 [Parastagonospora nodorum]